MKREAKLEESLNTCSKYAKRGQKIADNSISLSKKSNLPAKRAQSVEKAIFLFLQKMNFSTD